MELPDTSQDSEPCSWSAIAVAALPTSTMDGRYIREPKFHESNLGQAQDLVSVVRFLLILWLVIVCILCIICITHVILVFAMFWSILRQRSAARTCIEAHEAPTEGFQQISLYHPQSYKSNTTPSRMSNLQVRCYTIRLCRGTNIGLRTILQPLRRSMPKTSCSR